MRFHILHLRNNREKSLKIFARIAVTCMKQPWIVKRMWPQYTQCFVPICKYIDILLLLYCLVWGTWTFLNPTRGSKFDVGKHPHR